MDSRIGLQMCSKNIFFTLGFWVGLPQDLGFDFSVWSMTKVCTPKETQPYDRPPNSCECPGRQVQAGLADKPRVAYKNSV